MVVVGDGESAVDADAVAAASSALAAPTASSPSHRRWSRPTARRAHRVVPQHLTAVGRDEQLVHGLRDEVVPAAGRAACQVAITGATAASIDINEYVASRLPWFIGSVVVLSFLLLMTVFRSVLIALKAAVMNVLSIAAAYGVVVHRHQRGPLGDLVGISEAVPLPRSCR